MKKLPIKFDSYVITECWTFYKIAIIQTHSKYSEWLAGHMGLVMSDDYYTMYGNESGRFGMEYYNDILQFEEINISSSSDTHIVEIIKKEIDNGNYVIFDCNFNGLYTDAEPETHDIHEILIYGYNDEKRIAYTAFMSSEKFVEAEFPYKNIEKGYALTLKWFSEKPKEIYYRRSWFYPVTKIRLRNKIYCIDPLFNLIQKLDNEYAGCTCKKTNLNDVGVAETHTYYYGTSIVSAIYELCSYALKNDSKAYDKSSGKIAGTYVKLYEHGRMILDSVKWAYSKMNIDNDITAKELYKEYSNVVDLFQMLYRLCYKYRIKSTKLTLASITNKTAECMNKNISILKRMADYLREKYVEYVSTNI